MNYFTSLTPITSLSLDALKLQINKHLLTARGTVKPIAARHSYIERHNLTELMRNIRSACPHAETIGEAIYCLTHDLEVSTGCTNCKKPTRFVNTTKGYNPFCSYRCNAAYNQPTTSLSPEKKIAKAQKTSRALRGRKLDEKWRSKLSAAALKPEVQAKKAATCLERYGVANPGVMGAYSSKAAEKFIRDFIEFRVIDPDLCMFNAEGRDEYFQMIQVPWCHKSKYVSYDLVVFLDHEGAKNRDASKIEIVLEFQGPWHYKIDEIAGHEHEPATPYSNNRHTKWQQATIDDLKIRCILDKNPQCEYLTFWMRDGITYGYS